MDAELRGARVLVLGLGMSGVSAARFCAGRGARVVAAEESARELDAAALGPGVELRVGAPFPDPAEFDLVVPSPGVPRARYAGRARRALGDVELAFRSLHVPIVAVTGTNGKSTTVRLVEAMLRAAGLRAEAAGNVGVPALDLVGRPLDVAVLEVSSFQLEAVELFRPRVGVVLNVTDDHFDRHASLEAYAAAKARLFERQQPDDVAIANGDDPLARKVAAAGRGRLALFQRVGPVAEGAWWEGDAIALAEAGALERLPLDDVAGAPLPPRENVLAALLAARAAGADPRRALRALVDFAGLPHRLERVAVRDGVAFVDDSKATNPGAAEFALDAQRAPVVWIAGGRDKELSFDALAESARGRVRRALLVGEAAGKLARALEGRVPYEVAGTVEAAVRRAAEVALPGDVVLLAPACASFDQFKSYAERGERFRAAVLALGGEERP
ncbi:MAG TPA: UDP-N-acetylmuramoyl-L-alanine--D-glutamate ligase [Myxococcota bacterium]|nr:UDP-N-acetylmuramoyl-L-alanine--D-glutamate ligase [Myxococcota bacterium]